MELPPTHCPVTTSSVSAGFANVGSDEIEDTLNLHELLVDHPAATFFIRVEGESMRGASIQPDDILVVDRSLEPKPGRIIIALIEGEFTVKRLVQRGETYFLAAENPNYPDLPLTKELDFQVWGVVTYIIHKAT